MQRRQGALLGVILLVVVILAGLANKVINARVAAQKDARLEQIIDTLNNVVN